MHVDISKQIKLFYFRCKCRANKTYEISIGNVHTFHRKRWDQLAINVLCYRKPIAFISGAYPCLEVKFVLKRDIGFYMIQLYIPSVLIVILSWVAFWISVDAIPARVTIGLLVSSGETRHQAIDASLLSVWRRGVVLLMCLCRQNTELSVGTTCTKQTNRVTFFIAMHIATILFNVILMISEIINDSNATHCFAMLKPLLPRSRDDAKSKLMP